MHALSLCLSVQGCAIGAGFCAASHLDLVVSKLEQVMKEEMVRKSKGFFGLSKVHAVIQGICSCIHAYIQCTYKVCPMQDKSEADVERIKATVLLCYGYVTFHSPPK